MTTDLTQDSTIKISVVCTIFRAEQSVWKLVEELLDVLKPLTSAFEVILVDDCSPDSSWEKITEIGIVYPFVKGIKLSRNYGQQIAMSAGMHFCKGDYIVIMDGDLQNPPSAIPVLIEHLKNGYEIVYTVSKVRNNLKNELSSKLFWFLLTKIFKVNIIKNQLMMKAMTKGVLEKFNHYQEINRTVAGIINDIGMNHTVVQIENQKRHSGNSGYNFYKRFNLMIDIILSMTNSPLNIIINLSLCTFLLTILASCYHLFTFFFFDVPVGFTSIILSIFFFGSLILLILGIIGRYLSNIYTEVKDRPLFLVQKKINF